MPTKKTNKLFDINLILHKIGIKEKQQVADLGCGKFEYFVLPVAHLVGEKGSVYAVDILREAVEEIKKAALYHNLKQVKALWSNLEIFKGTRIESASLDHALIINVLNQSTKKLEILREASRLLKIGGRLLIIDWKLSASPFGPDPNRRVNPEAIKEAAPQLGLSLVEEFEAGPFHYGLIFNKL